MSPRHTFDVPPLTATPAGELVTLVGTPNDGDVPTFNAGLGYHTPQPPSGGVSGHAWIPLFSIVGGVGTVVLDANDDVVLTLVPVP